MLKYKQIAEVKFNDKELEAPYLKTFGEVDEGKPLMFDDDYGRVEMALNLGDIAKEYNIKLGDKITIAP